MLQSTQTRGMYMRINPINVVSPKNHIIKTKVKEQESIIKQQNINFNGKFGTYAGILLGGAVAIAAAVTVAPVLICGAAAAGIAGGMAGDKLEDKIKGDDKKKP